MKHHNRNSTHPLLLINPEGLCLSAELLSPPPQVLNCVAVKLVRH